MRIEDHYSYPDTAVEFGRFNFQRPGTIDQLARVFASAEPGSPRIIEIVGAKGSGRHYLLRAAAFEASYGGTATKVVELDLGCYEPGHPLKGVLEHLGNQSEGPDAARITDLAKRAKVELKVTPLNFLFVSLALKWDPTAEELLQLVQAGSPVGPVISEREQVGRLLNRLTEGRRLVLHVRDGRACPLDLRAKLIDETVLNPQLYVAFSYPEGEIRHEDNRVHRAHVAHWSREEMERGIKRLTSTRIPDDFVDFRWEFAGTRETLARVLLRISTERGGWVVASEDKQSWVIEKGWQKNRRLVEEFSRDLFEPVDDAMLGLPDAMRNRVREFLFAAALCDPMIPVRRIVGMLGLRDDAQEDFIDLVDELLGEEAETGVFSDLGFSHPGFPKGELLYRFRNPVVPGVVLKRCPNRGELATRLLYSLSGDLRPESRAIARLYLQLAEEAGSLREAEQYAHQLHWWTSLEETELLQKVVGEQLRARDISPVLLWSVIQKSGDVWPPARRMAMVEAYGAQSGGVPWSELFQFLLTKAGVLLDVGRYEEARLAAEQALGAPLPEPAWSAEASAHNVLGMAEIHLSHGTSAVVHLTRALQLFEAHLEPDHPSTHAVLNNLAMLYESQGRYEEAEPLFQRGRAARERTLGVEDPDAV